jgi:transcriptional regulator with XRE-family HTH domain
VEAIAVTAVGSGFAARLRERRIQRGLSQSDLAAPGVSASYISLLEAGRRAPTRQVAERLAARLDIDVDELLHGVSAEALTQARTDLSFAQLCLGQGDAGQAREVLEALVESGALQSDPERQFAARLALAEALERLGEIDMAIRRLEGLRAEAQSAPEQLPWLSIVVAMSRCYREAGDLQHAVAIAERALDRCLEWGLTGLSGHAQLVATLAVAYYERGDLTRAAVLLDELLAATGPTDRQGQAAAYWNAALIAGERGQHAEAERLAAKAAARIAEGDDERALARLKSTRAYLLLAQNPPDALRARALLHESLPALRQHDSAGAVASAEVELARCETLLGQPRRAREHAESALHHLGSDAALEIARARAVLGQALLASGDEAAARASLTSAAELLTVLGASRQASSGWRYLADVLMESGDIAEAAKAYRAALDAAGLPGLNRTSGQTAHADTNSQESIVR